MKLILKIYKTIDDPTQALKFIEGHRKVLEEFNLDEFLSKETASFFKNPNSYLICLEDNMTGEIIGGMRIQQFHKSFPLPIVNHFNLKEENIMNLFGKNCAELCGIWTNRKIDLPISEILGKFGVALCLELKINHVLAIAANYTLRKFQTYGFKPVNSIANYGQLKYSNSNFTVTALNLNLENGYNPATTEQRDVLEIFNNKKGCINFSSGSKEFEILFDLTIPQIITLNSNISIINSDLYLNLVNHPELLKVLEWRKFEILIADILETFGYNIQLMQGTKDGGIDIIAFNNSDEFGEHKYLLQAKRWSNKVGIDVVKNVLFNHDYHKVSKSCLVTTSSFTKGAWQLAKMYKWQLDLKDHDAIQNWLKRAWDIKTK